MIFCVEDDAEIRDLILYTLKNTGFEARGFTSGEELKKALEKELPQLILLDIMLPGEDGIAILKRLKNNSRTQDIPVIMVTAKVSEFDKVIGLDYGADDYVAKPFGMMELISRIKAVLRRSAFSERTEKTLSCGPITLDPVSHTVTVEEKPVTLTLKEFELLYMLLRNKRAVLTRDVLMEKIWGYNFYGETRTVDVHIRTLRQKLGAAGELIETVRGVGYRIDPEKRESEV